MGKLFYSYKKQFPWPVIAVNYQDCDPDCDPLLQRVRHTPGDCWGAAVAAAVVDWWYCGGLEAGRRGVTERGGRGAAPEGGCGLLFSTPTPSVTSYATNLHLKILQNSIYSV